MSNWPLIMIGILGQQTLPQGIMAHEQKSHDYGPYYLTLGNRCQEDYRSQYSDCQGIIEAIGNSNNIPDDDTDQQGSTSPENTLYHKDNKACDGNTKGCMPAWTDDYP